VDGVRAMGGGAMITTRSEIFALAPGDAPGDAAGEAREAVATATSSILVRGEGQ
jgi:hypothetical protein